MQEIRPYIAEIINNNRAEIEKWFACSNLTTVPLFYSSVDIRHAGFKIAPVDTNLFPAGFNQLSDAALERAVQEAKIYFDEHHADEHKVLIVTESHTRNLFYLDNVVALRRILENVGKEVQLGWFGEEELELTSASGAHLELYPLKRQNGAVSAGQFTPDMVLVNNDLSAGSPEVLQGLEQPVIPPTGLGWYQRRKTHHFETYSEVVREFGKRFELDPWLISTHFHQCGTINFKEKTGLKCVALGVEKVLHAMGKKYEEYGIKEEPYVFVKADSGTYGMGIMTARSGDEIMEINKKARNKMNVIKEGVMNSEVIIQEGVPTADLVGGKPAEPMVYLIGGVPVGCTYRVNENRDAYGNLNSQGMTFENACEEDAETEDADNANGQCPVLGLIARLATLAAINECYEPKWEI